MLMNACAPACASFVAQIIIIITTFFIIFFFFFFFFFIFTVFSFFAYLCLLLAFPRVRQDHAMKAMDASRPNDFISISGSKMRALAAQGAKPCRDPIPNDLLAANCVPQGFMAQVRAWLQG